LPITCLIAEADPFIASLLLRFAEESGLTSTRARTGEEILTLAPKIRPDILIVEPELPGEHRGWEAVRELHASGAIGSTTVISCSWLKQIEAHELIGDSAWHLQKLDLYYDDFVKVLEVAGVGAEDRAAPS
jgi:DNA-binding response OmpR family regulator